MSHARRSLFTKIRQRHVRLVHHMHKTIDNRETARNKHKINFIIKKYALSALSSQLSALSLFLFFSHPFASKFDIFIDFHLRHLLTPEEEKPA